MTTKELFKKIRDILKEKGKLPDILDYGLATDKPIPIRNYEFDLKNNLDYGGSEGIYLDLWTVYFSDGERSTHDLGTFKTLDSSNEAMHIMAGLLADFIIEESSYVSKNLDDFTWEGADVRAIEKLRPHIRDISFRTYYRRRREAIDALSSILWGYMSKDSIDILEKFFPDDKDAGEQK